MADKEVRKEAEENIVTKILENRFTTMILFGGFLVGVIFWVTNPQRAIETRLTIIEEKVASGNALSSQLQNIKDNDLHELHQENKAIQSEIDELKTQVAIMNANLDRILKKYP